MAHSPNRQTAPELLAIPVISDGDVLEPRRRHCLSSREAVPDPVAVLPRPRCDPGQPRCPHRRHSRATGSLGHPQRLLRGFRVDRAGPEPAQRGHHAEQTGPAAADRLRPAPAARPAARGQSARDAGPHARPGYPRGRPRTRAGATGTVRTAGMSDLARHCPGNLQVGVPATAGPFPPGRCPLGSGRRVSWSVRQ